ncbi:hypothetical protein Tco_0810065 [Tanacetum coccineum]
MCYYLPRHATQKNEKENLLRSAGSSGGNTGNAGGIVNEQGCSHKTFMNGKPHSFNGIEGVVGLRRWIEKAEQVFETCKCAEEDKVMFAPSPFDGRRSHGGMEMCTPYGSSNANSIILTEFTTMMTTNTAQQPKSKRDRARSI